VPVDQLVEALCAVLPSGVEVWVPAGIAARKHSRWPSGWTPHPDHALVRAAGLALREHGYPVVVYADLPHASASGWPDWVTGGAEPNGDRAAHIWKSCLDGVGFDPDGGAEVVRLSEATFRRKLQAARRYASQVEALEQSFGPLDDRALLGYEVVWRLPEPSSA
jgi:hypothetical protein